VVTCRKVMMPAAPRPVRLSVPVFIQDRTYRRMKALHFG